jgi:hypothetical protein
MSPWVWIVLVVIVVIVLALVLTRSRSKQLETRREKAAELREPTAEHNLALQEREASAAASEAEARRVRAEADARAAQAQQKEVDAQREAMQRDAVREEREAKLRQADLLDPDVKTDKEGYRLDEHGNRLEGRPGDGGVDFERDDVRRAERDDVQGNEAGRSGLREGEVRETEVRERTVRDPEGGGATQAGVGTGEEGPSVREGRESWQERARADADDVLGRRDTDEDGRRG